MTQLVRALTGRRSRSSGEKSSRNETGEESQAKETGGPGTITSSAARSHQKDGPVTQAEDEVSVSPIWSVPSSFVYNLDLLSV